MLGRQTRGRAPLRLLPRPGARGRRASPCGSLSRRDVPAGPGGGLSVPVGLVLRDCRTGRGYVQAQSRRARRPRTASSTASGIPLAVAGWHPATDLTSPHNPDREGPAQVTGYGMRIQVSW
jgi:hypothetical protein